MSRVAPRGSGGEPRGDPGADPGAEAIASARRWLGVGSGIYAIGGSIVCGLLTWLVLRLLAPLAADPPYPPDEIPASVRWCVEHRLLMLLLAVPALALGIVLLRARRRTVLLTAAATLAMVVPCAVAVYCFVRVLAPMYVYRG